MRHLLVVLLFAVTAPGLAAESFVFTAMGCMPYSRVPGLEAKLARLQVEIERHRPAFTIHLGDILSGAERASDERFLAVRTWFDSFDHPLIYTPGDNEWTDAHRSAIGSYEPKERLAKLRELFFSDERSRGGRPMGLKTQRRMPGHETYVENARWTRGGVIFATLHVVGSYNNHQPDIPGAVEEAQARNDANLSWLRATFAEAERSQAPGVVLFMQAQPLGYTYGVEGFMPGFKSFLQALEREVRAYGRPVLLVHADEHRYRHEQGVRIAHDTEPIPNLTRLGTFGDGDIHGVLVLVHPASAAVFTPGPLLVPGNH